MKSETVHQETSFLNGYAPESEHVHLPQVERKLSDVEE
jgi:hypothetical protein